MILSTVSDLHTCEVRYHAQVVSKKVFEIVKVFLANSLYGFHRFDQICIGYNRFVVSLKAAVEERLAEIGIVLATDALKECTEEFLKLYKNKLLSDNRDEIDMVLTKKLGFDCMSAEKSYETRFMISSSTPLGERVFMYVRTLRHQSESELTVVSDKKPFSFCSTSFFSRAAPPCFIALAACFLFSSKLEKNVSVRKSLAPLVPPSKLVALSRSKRKKGTLGRVSLLSLGLLRSLICSRLKIAYHLEYG